MAQTSVEQAFALMDQAANQALAVAGRRQRALLARSEKLAQTAESLRRDHSQETVRFGWSTAKD